MKLLVTGARGFLGRHVAQEALRRGHELFRLNVDLAADAFEPLVPQLDAVIHCAGITRWSPTQSDQRFMANLAMAARVAAVPTECFIFPLPHGALAPWNACSQSMSAAYERSEATPVYLPTLYGLGDPHHAKAIPSFLLAATGKGEQPIALYPPAGTNIWRHYMHVEAAARILVPSAEGVDVGEIVVGERWDVRSLAFLVGGIAAKHGRKLLIEERGWQWKPDGIGAPVPASIGPEPGIHEGEPREHWTDLAVWLDKVIGDALRPAETPAEPAGPPLPVLSAAAKYYTIALNRLVNFGEPEIYAELEESDRLWWAMSAADRAAVEKLLDEHRPSVVASADAPPAAAADAPLHDDGLPNPRSE